MIVNRLVVPHTHHSILEANTMAPTFDMCMSCSTTWMSVHRQDLVRRGMYAILIFLKKKKAIFSFPPIGSG
jgi:hypothetical protein